MLQYYFSESFRSFLEGDFEKSLIWGYKVIREKTIVDPLEYVDDKRTNKPSFGHIRNTLMHPRREGHIETDKIRRARWAILQPYFETNCQDRSISSLCLSIKTCLSISFKNSFAFLPKAFNLFSSIVSNDFITPKNTSSADLVTRFIGLSK